MSRISLGTITMPHGVSDNGTLLWFNKWMKRMSVGLEDYICIFDIIFFEEEYIAHTINFLIKSGWMLYSSNEIISPNGDYIIRLSYDHDSYELLKSIRND